MARYSDFDTPATGVYEAGRAKGLLAGLKEALEIAEQQDQQGSSRFTAAVIAARIADLEGRANVG